MGAVFIGCGLGALGGVDLALADVNYFISNMTAGRGYMALAAVILGRWDPVLALLICLCLERPMRCNFACRPCHSILSHSFV